MTQRSHLSPRDFEYACIGRIKAGLKLASDMGDDVKRSNIDAKALGTLRQRSGKLKLVDNNDPCPQEKATRTRERPDQIQKPERTSRGRSGGEDHKRAEQSAAE